MIALFQSHRCRSSRFPLLNGQDTTDMAGNKPLTREEFREYRKERDRIYKAVETAKRTVKVMYKSLCPT